MSSGERERATFSSVLASLDLAEWSLLNEAAKTDADARRFLERVRAGAIAAVVAGYRPATIAEIESLGSVDLGALGWAREVLRRIGG